LLGERHQIGASWERYTEPRPSRLSEGINVINLPKNIEPSASLAWCLKNLNHLILCKSSLSERLTWNGRTWWQNNATRAFYPGQIRESEISWKWMMLQPYYRGLDHFVCWRKTMVSEVVDDCYNSTRIDIRYSDWSHGNISPQLPFGGLFGPGYQVTRSDPQKYSGERENNCECSNDRFGVIVGKTAQTNAVSVERDRERGSTFLKILGCSVGIVLLHAALKWLGTYNNRPHRH